VHAATLNRSAPARARSREAHGMARASARQKLANAAVAKNTPASFDCDHTTAASPRRAAASTGTHITQLRAAGSLSL